MRPRWATIKSTRGADAAPLAGTRRLADLDDDVAELLDVAKPAKGEDRLLKGLSVWSGRPTRLPRRRVQVLVEDGLGNVRGGQV